jgi:hypothetical protein
VIWGEPIVKSPYIPELEFIYSVSQYWGRGVSETDEPQLDKSTPHWPLGVYFVRRPVSGLWVKLGMRGGIEADFQSEVIGGLTVSGPSDRAPKGQVFVLSANPNGTDYSFALMNMVLGNPDWDRAFLMKAGWYGEFGSLSMVLPNGCAERLKLTGAKVRPKVWSSPDGWISIIAPVRHPGEPNRGTGFRLMDFLGNRMEDFIPDRDVAWLPVAGSVALVVDSKGGKSSFRCVVDCVEIGARIPVRSKQIVWLPEASKQRIYSGQMVNIQIDDCSPPKCDALYYE